MADMIEERSVLWRSSEGDEMIPIVELIRLEEVHGGGTFGVMKIHKSVRHGIWTLEPADLENAPDVSSIPAQQYTCRRHSSPRHGECFKIMDVPERTDVLIHKGNTISDTLGCPVLGSSHGALTEGDRAVLNSGAAFRRFMNAMEGYDECHLTIKEIY